MCIYYLAKLLLDVGVDVDMIHTVRHFPLTSSSHRLRCRLQRRYTTNNEKKTGNERPRWLISFITTSPV